MMNVDGQWRFMHDQGLAFFGRIAASISHELKNHLAVINEQTGLMSDLLHFAGQGKPPSVQRLACLSQDIAEQVGRADLTLRMFGRFSHSVDQQHCPVDLADLSETIIGIAKRLAASKGVMLSHQAGTDQIIVKTSPFLLVQLVFLCLEHIIAQADGGGELRIGAFGDSGQAGIDLCLEGHTIAPMGSSQWQEMLLGLLHARICSLKEHSTLRIEMPLDNPNSTGAIDDE
jgi:signal transduction histidine kinase